MILAAVGAYRTGLHVALSLPCFAAAGTLKPIFGGTVLSRIRLLSEQVSNQIAAGEVVDRPAAVVKELVENSLDAQASRILVEIEGGGVGLVRVSDDGAGMDRDDALLCLERHATSKLHEAAELPGIRSLGFRGEAIPSIASVAWLLVLTRPQGEPLGTRVEVRHGVLRDRGTAGCGCGTVMEVRQLFANMPARKKFLKSQRTEIFHMEEAVKNLALAHPAVAFVLQVEGRRVLDYPPGESLEERLRRVFRYQDELIVLEDVADQGETGAGVSGFLLLPEKTSLSSAKLRLVVNGRAVQDNMLRFAVRDALQGYLMRGFQPAGLLRIEVPPGEVDVNVHPAKREIRFRNAEAVRRQVAASVLAALKRHERAFRESVFRPESPGAGGQKAGGPQICGLEAAGRAPQAKTLPWQTGEPLAPVPGSLPPALDPPPRFAADCGAAQAPVQGEAARLAPDSGSSFLGLRLIGQFFALYLLCERAGQLVIIDQHAAHERILYGRMVQHYLAGQAPGQALLFPETVELPPALQEVMIARQESVKALGFAVQAFGDNTWVIEQVPALTSALAAALVLQEVLTGLRLAPPALQSPAQDGEGLLPPVMAQIFANLACKAAIKGGRSMAPQEMLDLLAQMEQSAVFSHCPHGRPVIKIFSAAEVEQWFHRRE